MDPTIFGDDVVDNVDYYSAQHINNLRAWASAFIPIIANMTTVTTTDTTHTLTDTDTAFIVYTAVGSTDFKVYLPAASTDNHPFWLANATSDTANFPIEVLDSSSDAVGLYKLDNNNPMKPFLSYGTGWITLY